MATHKLIKTFKVRHFADLSHELRLARQVAEIAVARKDEMLSTKDVKHIGLNSTISACVLRKYGRMNNIKEIRKDPKLPLHTFNKRFRLTDQGLYIPSLKLTIDVSYIPKDSQYKYIELDSEWAYISVLYDDVPEYKPETAIGIDRNTNGHCVVAACPTDGTVFKLGKSAKHTREKYSNLLRHMQRKRHTIKIREARIMRDLNHKIAKKLVDEAIKRKAVLVLEDLKGIRRKTRSKKFGRLLNSWSYYQLQEFIEYKAKLRGVPVAYIDPRYTSQQCSKCGLIGKRQNKNFQCLKCGNVEHADVNAAFVIALRQMGLLDCPKKEIRARAIPIAPKGIGL